MVDEYKVCIKCNESKHIDLFANLARNNSGKTNVCKLCHNASKKQWLLDNPDKYKIRKEKEKNRAASNRQIIREFLLKDFGGACACCGENNQLLLAIDHINGGGRAQRKSLNVGGGDLAKLIFKGVLPKSNFRLLCHNCNSSLGYRGYCPHAGFCPVKTFKDRVSYRNHKRLIRQKLLVIENYGGKCECCKEDSIEFLTIDHKDGSGKEHRKEIGINRINDWLIDNNYPKDKYRLYCHNCNYATAHHGVCHPNLILIA